MTLHVRVPGPGRRRAAEECPSLPLAAAKTTTEISMLGVAGVVTAGLAVQRHLGARSPGPGPLPVTRPLPGPLGRGTARPQFTGLGKSEKDKDPGD